jgi:hypothetical protein
LQEKIATLAPRLLGQLFTTLENNRLLTPSVKQDLPFIQEEVEKAYEYVQAIRTKEQRQVSRSPAQAYEAKDSKERAEILEVFASALAIESELSQEQIKQNAKTRGIPLRFSNSLSHSSVQGDSIMPQADREKVSLNG